MERSSAGLSRASSAAPVEAPLGVDSRSKSHDNCDVLLAGARFGRRADSVASDDCLIDAVNRLPMYTSDATEAPRDVEKTTPSPARIDSIDQAFIGLLMAHDNRSETSASLTARADTLDSRNIRSAGYKRNAITDLMSTTAGPPATTRHRRGPRLTIFSEDFLKYLERKNGGRYMRNMLRSTAGVVVQSLVFVTMVLFLGITPLVKESALWDPVTQSKRNDIFISQTPFIVHFGLSVIVANIASWLTFGWVGVKDCWDLKSVIFVSRVSIFYSIGESMELITLVFVDSTSWKILNQLKLPITALLHWVFLKRNLTATQWTLIASISCAITGYCYSYQTQNQDLAVSSGVATLSVMGMTIGVVNVLIVTMAGVVADVTYKQVKFPFYILVAQGRLSACFFTVLLMVADQIRRGELSITPGNIGFRNGRGMFDGWNKRVFLLTMWLLVKDWSVTFVLRNLDSIWKALGTAMGLCVTYVLANLILTRNYNFLILIFVVLVVINIICFTLTKRDVAVAEKKLEVLQLKLIELEEFAAFGSSSDKKV